jgi:hypothetical protein
MGIVITLSEFASIFAIWRGFAAFLIVGEVFPEQLTENVRLKMIIK